VPVSVLGVAESFHQSHEPRSFSRFVLDDDNDAAGIETALGQLLKDRSPIIGFHVKQNVEQQSRIHPDVVLDVCTAMGINAMKIGLSFHHHQVYY